MNKVEMARVVVKALYNLDRLPEPTNRLVKRFSRNKLDHLQDLYDKALRVLKRK